MAALFSGADVLFDFATMLACCGGVYFYCVTGVLNLVEFLIHHNDADNIAGLSVKFEYFCKGITELCCCV